MRRAPISAVIAVPLGPEICLTLVRSVRGYCSSTWCRCDEQTLSAVTDEHKSRAFPTVDEAAEFFRTLLGFEKA